MEGFGRGEVGKGLLLSGVVRVVGRWLLVGMGSWTDCCCEMSMLGLSIKAGQRVVGSIVSGGGAQFGAKGWRSVKGEVVLVKLGEC